MINYKSASLKLLKPAILLNFYKMTKKLKKHHSTEINDEPPSIKKVHSAPQECKEYLGSFKEAPPHHQDNEHILSGYRLNHSSLPKILKSLFMIHN